ncbi:hypothetical protein [Streptomyces sp. NPDC001135]
MIGTAQADNRLGHIPFNRLTDMNEQLVRGREGIWFGRQFATKALRKLPDYVIDCYVRILASQHDALRGSFGWYRAFDTTAPRTSNVGQTEVLAALTRFWPRTSHKRGVGDPWPLRCPANSRRLRAGRTTRSDDELPVSVGVVHRSREYGDGRAAHGERRLVLGYGWARPSQRGAWFLTAAVGVSE